MLCWFQVYNNVLQLHIYMHLFFFLEKEMATHSSILAWKIPRIEELGKLQSMGSQSVGHN